MWFTDSHHQQCCLNSQQPGLLAYVLDYCIYCCFQCWREVYLSLVNDRLSFHSVGYVSYLVGKSSIHQSNTHLVKQDLKGWRPTASEFLTGLYAYTLHPCDAHESLCAINVRVLHLKAFVLPRGTLTESFICSSRRDEKWSGNVFQVYRLRAEHAVL